MTDAFGNTLAGRRSACWRITAQRSLRLSSQGGRHSGDQCHQSDGGDQYSHPTINSSSQSRDVTFVADVRTRRSLIWWSLRTTQWLTVQWRYAAGEGHRCIRECAEWTDGRVTADNSATVSPTVTTEPDGQWRSVSPARPPESVRSLQPSQQHREPERDVYRRCQDGEDPDLVVIKDDSVADGAMANMLG